MRRLSLIILMLVLTTACSENKYSFSLKGSAILKDKKIVRYDLSLSFKNDVGVKEITKKEERIKHAIRIIVAQRVSKHLDNPLRLNSVLQKVFKSQLKQKVLSIEVNSFKVE